MSDDRLFVCYECGTTYDCLKLIDKSGGILGIITWPVMTILFDINDQYDILYAFAKNSYNVITCDACEKVFNLNDTNYPTYVELRSLIDISLERIISIKELFKGEY